MCATRQEGATSVLATCMFYPNDAKMDISSSLGDKLDNSICSASLCPVGWWRRSVSIRPRPSASPRVLVVHPLATRARTSTPELPRSNSHDLILAIAGLNVQQNRHHEIARGELRRRFDRLNGEDVNFLIFLV